MRTSSFVYKSTLFLLSILFTVVTYGQKGNSFFHYTVSIPQPDNHTCLLELHVNQWNRDTLQLKMPRWTPGYYQLMEYAGAVSSFSAKDEKGKILPFEKVNDNTWLIKSTRNKLITINYVINTSREFVASSYIDQSRAYLVPANTFMYPEGSLQHPVTVKIKLNPAWKEIATGLEPSGKTNEFYAPDFDILYDCPLLIGNLEELPSFKIRGIEHRFVGYNLGNFDKARFMENLKKVVEAAADIIGDIPYKQYTFIGIGAGQGGIEHLNNTTVSFEGSNLNEEHAMIRMMNFLAHEYFHHYNVKRIRPFELGPFDYDKGNRTNLLWVSEGLTVYYEYMILKKAGLTDSNTLLAHLSDNITSVESNPGRLYQSLQQASYNTWHDGPFGTQGNDPGKSISYYSKGPVVGLFLDFEIRRATTNKKSLDDVMRTLYWKYYKKEHRGFTEAEFQETCELVAGIPLTELFEYVYTTKELDYTKYLGYAGLKIDVSSGDKGKKWMITRIEKTDALQQTILKSWLRE